MKTVGIIILSVCLCLSGTSQSLPKIIPPSPSVASFQRYSEIPVGYYTGAANISVPIYQITTGDLSMPISIGYNASGIRVSDEASQVGLGWNLVAGGSISRMILGGDDFASNPVGYHSSAASTPNITKGVPTFPNQLGCEFNLGNFPTSINDFLLERYDYQPDQYSFNIPGYSGKFILDKSKNVILQQVEKLKIEPLDADGNGWKIVTEAGQSYTFQEYETYTDNENSSAGPPGTYKTAWFLSKIESAKGEVIELQYTTVTGIYIKPIGSVSESQNPNLFYYDPLGMNNDPSTNTPPTLLPPTITPVAGKEYKKIYLNKIIFEGGELRFNYSTDRLDILNDVKLSSVQLFRKDYNPITYFLLKQWILEYSYFIGSNDRDFQAATLDQETRRLKLVSITEKDAAGNALKPYTFKYLNEDTINAQNYPAKTSFARDHWGYYNGKTQNSSLIPTYSPLTGTNNIVDYYLGVMGDNRNPDPNYSQLFMLYQVTYPTGGRSEFEYETNDFNYALSVVNDNSYYRKFADPIPVRIGPLFYDCNFIGTQPTTQDLPNKLIDLNQLYVIQGATTSEVTFTAFFRYPDYSTICRDMINSGKVSYTLTKEDGSIIEGPIDPITSTASDIICTGGTNNYIGFKIIRKYNLVPGKYIWKLTIQPGTEWLQDLSLTIDAVLKDEGLQNSNKESYGGGLRIKKISSYDGVITNNPIIKKYEYQQLMPDSTYRSSGIRLAKPIYSYFEKGYKKCVFKMSGGSYIYMADLVRLMRSSDSQIPLNGAGDNYSVAYSKVTELHGENGEFGKTEYYYENKPDWIHWNIKNGKLNGIDSEFPTRPSVQSSLPNRGNGNLVRQIDYRSINGTYQKSQETTNSYFSFTGSDFIWYGIERREIEGGSESNNPCFYETYTYPAIIQKRNLLTKTVSLKFDQNDEYKSIQSVTDYTYDHTNHLQLIQVKVNLDGANFKVTSFTYPADYSDNDAGTVVSNMKNQQHMHNAILTKKVSRNGTSTGQLIEGEINRYQYINGKPVNMETALLELSQPVVASSINNYLPIQGSTYPSNYSGRIIFDQYDASNNIIQFHKSDDVSISYIWDYGNTLPIAEASNAIYTDIAFTSFEADGTGNWTVPSTARGTASVTGSRSYNLTNGSISKSGLANGKAYVISYWTRNSTPYNISGATTQISRTGRSYNGWKLYEHEIMTTGTSISITGSGWIDEVRCYPVGATMSTLTHLPLVGISSQCDVTNKINYYQYDGYGRLQLVKDMDGNVLKTFEYKLKQ